VTPEQKAKHFDDILYSDCFDSLLVYRLKTSLKDSIDSLETWAKQASLNGEQWQYFVETIKYCRSVLFVLSYFSEESFEEELLKVNKYTLILEENL
jgi:hypothetical protein